MQFLKKQNKKTTTTKNKTQQATVPSIRLHVKKKI